MSWHISSAVFAISRLTQRSSARIIFTVVAVRKFLVVSFALAIARRPASSLDEYFGFVPFLVRWGRHDPFLPSQIVLSCGVCPVDIPIGTPKLVFNISRQLNIGNKVNVHALPLATACHIMIDGHGFAQSRQLTLIRFCQGILTSTVASPTGSETSTSPIADSSASLRPPS